MSHEKTKAPAIDHGVMILDVLSASSYPLTLSEICESTGISPATGHRVVNALLQHQLVAKDPGRKKAYCIGSRVFQISSTIYNKQSLVPLFYPIAEILKNEIHKSIFLCVPIGSKVVVVSKVDASSNDSVDIFIGKTMAIQESAAGKAILSMRPQAYWKDYCDDELPQALDDESHGTLFDSLDRARRLGYAISSNLDQESTGCIATPVLNMRNEPIAAISAVIHGGVIKAEDARSYSKFLVQAARQLSARVI
ncbi:IclR family transcriptional regulator [Halomonas borealis]|uniref:IclR family transcriptional regulator n=1 Tax=Halomonas borealis TaxID=2508710 RepID=UPI001F0D3781|nr:IclR family transcriptional regulator C-terminal domain-containing protein [Halomonas borealis]